MGTTDPTRENITVTDSPTEDEFVQRSGGRDTYGDWGPPCYTAFTGAPEQWERHVAACAKCQRLVRTGRVKVPASSDLKPGGQR